MPIGNTTARYLARAGWFEGRRCDTSIFQRTLRDDGYREVLPAALRFVEQFGGLSGKFESMPGGGGSTTYDFNSVRAVGDIYRERVDDYAAFFGFPLNPVGEIYNGHVTLMVAADGSLLGGYDENFYLYGLSMEAGLDVVFEGREVKVLQSPDGDLRDHRFVMRPPRIG